MAKKYEPTEEELEIARIRLPREGEVLGIVEAMVGGDRMKVACDDGKERICRIPGKLRKRVWIKEGDLILVLPWKVQGDKRGDVIFRYTPTQASWLKKNGYIKSLQV
jgi:translation initiation factor 1A